MDRAHACHKAVRGLIPAASKCFITVAASRKMDPYTIKQFSSESKIDFKNNLRRVQYVGNVEISFRYLKRFLAMKGV